MTPIALVLNLLLGALLVAALALGIRLDRRLKALRESQQSFIKAVADLDQAAARTHAGLQQWRDAADEAREMLHDRIEKAKLQTAKLDALLSRPIPDPSLALAPAPAPPPASRIAELARKFERPQAEPEVRDAEARAEVFAAMLTGAGRQGAPAVRPILDPRPPLDLRSRAPLNVAARPQPSADDDLFEMRP